MSPADSEKKLSGAESASFFFVLFAVRVDIMAQITDVCAAGGADGPYELILEYVGGRMPGGPPRSQAERTWQRMRSWVVLCRVWLTAWRQYQREE